MSWVKPHKSKRSHNFSLIRRGNLLICANPASGLVCEEAEIILKENRRDKLLGAKLHFLEERDEEILSKRAKLHFLEERDEEILSKRIIDLSHRTRSKARWNGLLPLMPRAFAPIHMLVTLSSLASSETGR